ncbi:MAG: hypothetical protein JJ866_13735 [Roseibium sp.]|uniref:hypothetical protein n=1 Tax=Roseibium sp. TaxID=1936156 RepID=UPI001B1526E0|nr:hypothetical protein [Roseibium sp.]MBO6892998.1 hypothetical protein [Roseibium sp.]MBO6929441.1 hypothetical protein [Roseibium sp.]
MSRDTGGITITFSSRFTQEHWISLINAFEDAGFRLKQSAGASIQYLPLRSNFGDYDWQYEPIDKEGLFKVVAAQVLTERQVGFALYPPAEPNAEIHVCSQKSEEGSTSISFFLHDHAKTIDGGSVTDFSAYLRLIAPVCYSVFGEFHFECWQYIDRM